MILEDEDIPQALQKSLASLELEFLCIVKKEEEDLSFLYATYPYLEHIRGSNVLLEKHILEESLLETQQLNTILSGIMDPANIEDLQYSRRIKQVIGIPEAGYMILAGSSTELNENLQPILFELLKIIILAQSKLFSSENRMKNLENEIRLHERLKLFVPMLLTSGNIHAMSEYIAHHLPEDLQSVACIVALKNGSTWKLESISQLPEKASSFDILDRSITGYTMVELEDKPVFEQIRQLKTFKTNKLEDILPNNIDTAAANKIQELLQARLVYVVPICYHDSLYGVIIHLFQEKDISHTIEEICKDYSSIISSAFSLSSTIESMESSKQSIEAAYKKLEEINKEKDNLISMASHELRTPATVARNAISLILEYKTIQDQNVLEKMEMVKESADRELNIITTMLEASRINTKKMELVYQKVDVDKLIRMAVEELTMEAEKKGLRMEYISSGVPLPEVRADSTRIREVIDNLLTNAIKYTENGRITISSDLMNNFIEVAISDTGKGIPENVQGTLFQMFHRINSSNPLPYGQKESHQGGLGLGLYIVKSIIDAHNGNITVQSEVGKGSTFTFRIPIL